jgi:hypothetical protein
MSFIDLNGEVTITGEWMQNAYGRRSTPLSRVIFIVQHLL